MPTYTFQILNGAGGMEDTSGVSLRDRSSALRYARDVAGELMRGREVETRAWRLDVNEGDERIFELSFASLDSTLDHLSPQLRETIEHLCEHRRSFTQAVHDVKATLRESRALVARSRGELYIAAEFGKSVIRDRE